LNQRPLVRCGLTKREDNPSARKEGDTVVSKKRVNDLSPKNDDLTFWGTVHHHPGKGEKEKTRTSLQGEEEQMAVWTERGTGHV